MFFAPSKIQIESQNLHHGCIKDQLPYPNKDQDANPSQEPPASSKAPNQDLQDMDVLCTFKIKIEPKFGSWVCQRPVTIFKSRSRCKTPVRNLQHPPKPQMRMLEVPGWGLAS